MKGRNLDKISVNGSTLFMIIQKCIVLNAAFIDNHGSEYQKFIVQHPTNILLRDFLHELSHILYVG